MGFACNDGAALCVVGAVAGVVGLMVVFALFKGAGIVSDSGISTQVSVIALALAFAGDVILALGQEVFAGVCAHVVFRALLGRHRHGCPDGRVRAVPCVDCGAERVLRRQWRIDGRDVRAYVPQIRQHLACDRLSQPLVFRPVHHPRRNVGGAGCFVYDHHDDDVRFEQRVAFLAARAVSRRALWRRRYTRPQSCACLC